MNAGARKSFLGAAIGTLVEYYDYALFAIFLPIISPVFFPAATVYQSLVKGYYVMLITMFARPLGGIFFGHIGDILGRRRALLASMYGIALATFAMGLTPGYASIGFWAAVSITLAKAVQIFCFGGELNGAGIYVVEHAQNKNEGLVSALLMMTTLVGGLFASLMGIFVTSSFMPVWSWRLAFVVGGIIGILGVLYRKNLLESPQFERTQQEQHKLSALIKGYPFELLAGVFIGGFATIPFTTVMVFINPVLMSKGILTNHQLMLLQALFTVVAMITLIPTGLITNKVPPHKVMLTGALALAGCAYPFLVLIDSGNLWALILASMGFIVINEILLGPCNAFLKNLFPMQYRYRGSSLSFGLGMSLFGGLTPLIDSYLYQWLGHFSALSFWLIFVGIGTYLSISGVSKKQSSLGTLRPLEALLNPQPVMPAKAGIQND